MKSIFDSEPLIGVPIYSIRCSAQKRKKWPNDTKTEDKRRRKQDGQAIYTFARSSLIIASLVTTAWNADLGYICRPIVTLHQDQGHRNEKSQT